MRRTLNQGVMEAVMDLFYLAGIALFFALLIGLALGCNRLGGAK
jgi:ABC-type methionine transport system permease subunit